VSLQEKEVPEVVASHGLAGIDSQCLLKVSGRLVRTTLLREDRPEIGVRVRIGREKLDRFAELDGRVGPSTLQLEGGAYVPMAFAQKLVQARNRWTPGVALPRPKSFEEYPRFGVGRIERNGTLELVESRRALSFHEEGDRKSSPRLGP
jgi:hypothetical protein